jgi:hypothetical protein
MSIIMRVSCKYELKWLIKYELMWFYVNQYELICFHMNAWYKNLDEWKQIDEMNLCTFIQWIYLHSDEFLSKYFYFTHELIWISVKVCVFTCINVDLCGFIWIYLNIFEYIWILYEFIAWIVRLSSSAAVCGSAAVLCGSAVRQFVAVRTAVCAQCAR